MAFSPGQFRIPPAARSTALGLWLSEDASSTYCPENEAHYPETMAAKPVMTADELVERVRHAAPPTEDDVTILWDGRRLDSRESALEWLAEVAAKRAEEAVVADGRA